MKKTFLLLLALCCLNAYAQYIQHTASFNFANPNELGITPSTSNGGAVALVNTVLTDGLVNASFGRELQNDTPPTIFTYKHPYTDALEYYLRMQSGSTMTFSTSDQSAIKTITFETGGTIGEIGNLALAAGQPGTLSGKVWDAGSTNPTSVTFRCGNSQARITKVVISYQEASITLSPTNVTLVDGAKDLPSFTSMSLTFATPMTAQTAAGSIRLTGQYADGTNYSQKPDVSGNSTRTITLSVDKISKDGTFTMNIPAQSFRNAAGYENLALSYTFKVRLPFDTLSVSPVNNSEMYSLEFPITLTFPNDAENAVGKVDTDMTLELKRDGVTLPLVIKAVKGEGGNVLLKTRGANNTLEDSKSFSTLGTYTLEVKEKTVFDLLYGTDNQHYNPSILLTYKVIEKPDPLKEKKEQVVTLKKEAADLFTKINTVGYPKSDSSTHPLSTVKDQEVATTEEDLDTQISNLQAALKAFYDATDVLLPFVGEWYTIASVNKAGESLPLSYVNGAVLLGGKAAAFLVESITDGVAVLKTSDGKYLHVLMDKANTTPTSNKNVTEEKTFVNNLTLAKLTIGTLGTDDQKACAGLFTIEGDMGNDKNGGTPLGVATALVNHKTKKIITESKTVFFEDSKTSAFRFVKTEKPQEDIYPVAIFDGAVTDSNTKMLTLVIQGQDNAGDVTKVTLKQGNKAYFTHVVGGEEKIATYTANPILEAAEGSTNRFNVHLNGLAGGMYKLVIPEGTFDFSSNPKKVTDKKLEASFSINNSGESGGETPEPGSNNYDNYGSLPEMWGTIPTLMQGTSVTDTDLLEVYYYVTGIDIYPNKDAAYNVVKLSERWHNKFIAQGHFESVYRDGQHMLKIVYDDDTPLVDKLPLANGDYTLTIGKAAYGDTNFNKRQNGDTTIPESDCRVNKRVLYNNLSVNNSTEASTAFANYKSEQKVVATNKAKKGDSEECTKLISDAKAAIDALTYDTTKSLDENKARVDAIISKLDTDLAAQRAQDAIKAKFASYKKDQKALATNRAQKGDSKECEALITAAKAAIDALTFDSNKSLDENKARVDAIISKLDTDLAAQRALDASKEALSQAITDATNYLKSIKDEHAAVANLLSIAIDGAKAKLKDTASSKAELDAAKQTLDAALDAAKQAIATGIYEIEASGNEDNVTYYTLEGRKLDGKPTKKGVYIVNGRKVVVK